MALIDKNDYVYKKKLIFVFVDEYQNIKIKVYVAQAG
jgi:hypothetical protein